MYQEFVTWSHAYIVPLATIVGAFSALAAVIYKFIGKPLKEILKQIKRIDEDTADLIWDRLEQAHDEYLTRGWASVQEKSRVQTMYDRYKAKGRNHLAANFIDDIKALPSTKNIEN